MGLYCPDHPDYLRPSFRLCPNDENAELKNKNLREGLVKVPDLASWRAHRAVVMLSFELALVVPPDTQTKTK